jgi:hypothetical protein
MVHLEQGAWARYLGVLPHSPLRVKLELEGPTGTCTGMLPEAPTDEHAQRRTYKWHGTREVVPCHYTHITGKLQQRRPRVG